MSAGNPYQPEDPGLLSSVLGWLAKPGYAVRNVLKGNFAGAARNVGDILGDAVDSVLPGDWIPEFSSEADKPHTSDLVGGMDDGIAKTATNFIGDTLTDPLTYVPGLDLFTVGKRAAGALGAGVNAAKAVSPALEGVADKAVQLGGSIAKGVRSTFGAENLSPEVRAILDKNIASGKLATAAQQQSAAEALAGADLATRQRMSQVIHDYVRDAETGKAVPILPPVGPRFPDSGPHIPDAADAVPASDYMQVKAPGSRQPIPDLDKSLGIMGVADPKLDIASSLGMGDVSAYADEAADAARAAWPRKPTDPRFMSGIDFANRAHGVDITKKTYGPNADIGVKLTPKLETDGGIQNVNKLLGAAESPQNTITDIAEQLAKWEERINALPISDAEKTATIALAQKYAPVGQQSYRDLVERGAYYKPEGIDILKQSPTDYMSRKFSGIPDETDLDLIGNPSLSKARTLRSNANFRDFINDPANAGVKLEEDLGKATIDRAQQHGALVTSAGIARDLIGKTADEARQKLKDAPWIEGDKPVFDPTTGVATKPMVPDQSVLSDIHKAALANEGKAYTEDGVKTAANGIIAAMRKAGAGDDADRLQAAMSGIGPRGAATQLLASNNSIFKKAAVYGAFIPRIGAHTSNLMSGIWQTLSNPESRASTGAITKQMIPNFLHSIDDGVEKLFGNRVATNDLAEIETAFNGAGGDVAKALANVSDPTARAAMEQGVFHDGFVSSEDLLKAGQRDGWKKFMGNWMDMPGKIFQGGEQRMRYGLFKDLVERHGKSPQDAGRIVNDTFYNYSTTSAANRTARDFIPFFQFTAKAIPQQAKFLAEKPYVATALSSVYGGANGPIYPFMEGKADIPLGQDANGDQEYIAGTRLPFESLSNIPNPSADLMDFGRQVEQNVVGSSNPLLKTAYSAVSGKDPYFDMPYGTYGKVAGVDLGSAGRQYNKLANTGAIQPIDSLLQTLGTATGDKTLGAKALNLLGGVNVASVDESKALQRQLEDYLKRNPEVGQYTSFFSTDPEAEKLNGILEDLKAAKATNKAKKKAASSAVQP